MNSESSSGLRRKISDEVVIVAIQAITLGKKGHFAVRAE